MSALSVQENAARVQQQWKMPQTYCTTSEELARYVNFHVLHFVYFICF